MAKKWGRKEQAKFRHKLYLKNREHIRLYNKRYYKLMHSGKVGKAVKSRGRVSAKAVGKFPTKRTGFGRMFRR